MGQLDSARVLNRQQRRALEAAERHGENPREIVRLAQVAKERNVSRDTLYRWAKQLPDFPPRRVFGPGTRGWLRAEIDHWFESRTASQPAA